MTGCGKFCRAGHARGGANCRATFPKVRGQPFGTCASVQIRCPYIGTARFRALAWRLHRLCRTILLAESFIDMIQSLSSQPASMLSSLLSGFTAKDRNGDADKGKTLAGAAGQRSRPAGNASTDVTGQSTLTSGRVAGRTPDGVPAVVARAFPDFANLALGIVDRASLGTAASGAQAQAEAELMGRITDILGPAQGAGSLSSQFTDAQSALAAWQANPQDPAVRDDALSALKGLVSRTNSTVQGLGNLSRSLDQQIDAETQAVQTGLSRLTAANEAVVAAKSSGGDLTGPEAERKKALAALSERVQLNFQDRPDGALIPVSADGSALPDKLDDVSDLSLRSGLTGGRLKALVELRDVTLPDLQRQARAIAAGLGQKLNDAATAAPSGKLVGVDTGLGPNDRLSINGAASFVLVDAQGQVQSATTIDFNARTRRSLGVPASGTSISTPAQLAKSVSETFKGQASLSFNAGTFSFESLSDKFRVAIVPQDRTVADRSLVQVTGLGRLVDAPVAEGAASGFQPLDAHEFTPGQTMTMALDAPNGRRMTADVTIAGRTFQDVLDQINNKQTGFGNMQFLGLDKEGSLTKAYSSDWVGARLSVINDQTSRADTGRSFSSLFALDTPKAPALADGVNLSDLGNGRAVIDDKTRRGSPLVRPENTSTINSLSRALGTEVIVPASLGKPTRVLGLASAAGELANGAADRADAATRRQGDARAFGLALKDERGRLSSASFGAELAHLSVLQTARNMSGRLDQQSTGMIAHLDRALTRKAAGAAQSIVMNSAPSTFEMTRFEMAA